MKTLSKMKINGEEYIIEELGEGFYKLIKKKNNEVYTVNTQYETCSCPSYQYKGECKHISALKKHLGGKNMKNEKVEVIDLKKETKQDKEEIPSSDQQGYYIIMERKDEEQIMEEIKGRVIEEYVYDFEISGRRITGLSYAGVKALALKQGGIHVGEPIINDYGDFWLCKVKAHDIVRNISVWGVATQRKKFKLRTGDMVDDEFAIQKVVSKAERNAMRKLIPETLIIEVIKEWREKKKKLNVE